MLKQPTKTRTSRPRRPMPVREVIEELQGEIRVYRSSYREVDGEVRNPGALRTIAALKEAIRIVRNNR